MNTPTALSALACCLLVISCATQPRFREDARVLAARGALEPWTERHDTAAKRAVFLEAAFQPGEAPRGRVELHVWDDADLDAAHGILRVRFLPQGWSSDGPVVTWVRLFDAQGKLLAETHPWDHANKDQDVISPMMGADTPWNREAFFDLPRRVASDAVRVEVFLDGFFHAAKS